jgi:hypothetical protein
MGRNHAFRVAGFLLILVGYLVAVTCTAPRFAKSQAWSGILDPSRAVDWSQAGFVISEPASQCSNQTGSYSPSGGDDAANINALIGGCTGGGYVLLSSGTFLFQATGLQILHINNVVLRGQGPDHTKLLITGSYSCSNGNAYACVQGNKYANNYFYLGASTTWTGDNGAAGIYGKGDTVIDVGSTSGLSVGQMIFLDQDNDSFGFLQSGTGCSESSSTVTCNTGIAHNFSPGDRVYVGGTAYPTNNDCGQGTAAGYAGYWTVASVPTSTSFTYTDTNTGLSTCTGGYASKDTGGIFITNIQNETVDQNEEIGRTCPDSHNPACQVGEISTRANAEAHVITNISGTQLTITPPVMMNNWRSSQNPGLFWTGAYPTNYSVGDGIEDLTIDASTGAQVYGTVSFLNAYKCWLKNTRIISGDTAHVDILASSNIDVLDNYMVGTRNGQSKTYGILSDAWSSNDLIQNNILQHMPACIITNGDHGSVWAYNYCTDDAYASPAVLGQELSAHGVAGMVLWEGNDVPESVSDVIHGASDTLTLFRNRSLGNDIPLRSNLLYSIIFAAFNRGENVVGNILGSVGSQTQYTQLTGIGQSNGYVYALGLPDQNGSNVPLDPVVQSTVLRWGNYDVVTGAVRWCGDSSDPGWSTTCGSTSEIPTAGVTYISGNTVPATTTLPNSFYLSAQPAFWTMGSGYGPTPPWPAIGPDMTGGTAPDGAGGHSYSIPAQLCYNNTSVDSSYQNTYAVNGASWSNGTVTLTTTTNTLAQYDTIHVSGVNPSGYNGVFQATAATSTSVSYAVTSNPGSYVSGGTVTSPNILLFNAANCYPNDFGGGPDPPPNLTSTAQ